MKPADLSRRLIKGVYRATRIAVWILTVFAVLGVALFLFLRTYGVPQPVLQEILRRVNAAGIPVEVEGITLTFHGWRADAVRYYSSDPDDLNPLFSAEQVFFSVRNSKLRRAGSDTLSLDIRAVDVELSPSVEWGIEIPQESPSRQVESMEVSLEFLSDRIRVSEGKMLWLGITFLVDGSVLKRGDAARIIRQRTLLPETVTEAQFRAVEDYVSRLSLPDGAVVDLEFTIDQGDYAASRIALAVNAENVGYHDGGFSRVEITGTYAYPVIAVERAALFEGKQSLQVDGEYNLQTRQARGSLFNSITSDRALLVLPAWFREWLADAEVQMEHLPRLTLDFGPAAAEDLLNHLSGVFSIRGLGYQGLKIDALRGRIARTDNRLECTNLEGSILGIEDQAEIMGSAMQGGPAEGSVFWDGNTREFGVEVDASFDPNLLVQALSFSKIATNIIRRFSFKNNPPEGHVSLGSNVDDWGTFFINIRAVANDVAFQGVDFSSINVVQTYRNNLLKLDPVAGTQDSNFIKGYAHVDLGQSTVAFDAVTSLNPADVEELIYPDINLFGHHIKAEGNVRISARGIFDWESMRSTDFTASVETDHLEIPIARLDRFSAEVIGAGTNIAVRNAQFELYRGKGSGAFNLSWNPYRPALPYAASCSFSGVDFRECLVFVGGGRPVTVTGIMEGNARITADFSTNFFTVANGDGFVRVEKGQLADLPLFQGFSRLMRKMIPSFRVFSINSLRGHFTITDGVIASEDAYFGGDVISAKGRGSYRDPDGFDASIQAQVLSEGRISKVLQVITDPLMKLFEMKLEGTLADPSWQMQKF